MAKIKAFKGYRYNSSKIENIGSAMVPPYDTISDEEQLEYYNSSEYNIIRISKGLKNDNDKETDNCYTRAGEYLEKWIKEDILIRL